MVLIALVWVITPFMGDRVPPIFSWGYVALFIGAAIFGVVVAVRSRAWPILLVLVLRFFPFK
ncbi:hypothetical protein C3B44_02630 [Corynebacterium yudongzhengii]|uniref:Uncharacterized protein n=1 Tax=Corynebacterium yudongzhengii TaxID=2080740 RepID=A0A2U1T758_9CORY|nr:hypothetical protein [Corynebacterium yudongzhengii]AWB81384.1 hypothetical protein C3B44_02630 [Corynebacterium yudongzhengii]PWC01827.1 hypothetical protein DF222_05715 [Corynebacterium yudongzhengii]